MIAVWRGQEIKRLGNVVGAIVAGSQDADRFSLFGTGEDVSEIPGALSAVPDAFAVCQALG
jgi:hypothetical protein